MTREQALQAARELYRAGELSADEYELERMSIEYAHGEAQTAADEEAA